MYPDSTQFLSYLADRTTEAQLHTSGLAAPLDNLSDGRAMFSMGRGLGAPRV